jgi:type II secretory pathway component PulL
MSQLIVLPPLTSHWHADPLAKPLQLETLVMVVCHRATAIITMAFEHALRQYPKAYLALHPVDAPLYAVKLPPLPANRRETAVRAKLEDSVLNDIHQLQLAIKPLGNHQFSVATAAKSTLSHVASCLKGYQQRERVIVPLTAYLSNIGEYTMGDWLLWHDATGAGALPLEPNTAVPALTPQSLSRHEKIAFTSTQPSASVWQRWRVTFILMALCGLVALINLGLTWRHAIKQMQQIDAEITRLFKATLPNTPLSGQPVVQLEQALGINANPTASEPLTFIQAVSALPTDWPSGAVTALSWQTPRLTVTLNSEVMNNFGIDETQQTALSDSFAAKNITFIWSPAE